MTLYISFVYGELVVQKREEVWERLTRIGITRFKPWLIIGDLNDLRGNHEKEGGNLREASSFLPFNSMISNCGLIKFPIIGNSLSWRGRRNKGVVRCKLDRALGNGEWHSTFSFSHVAYLSMIGSDHRPILGRMHSKTPRKQNNNFRFDKRWLDKGGVREAIDKG